MMLIVVVIVAIVVIVVGAVVAVVIVVDDDCCCCCCCCCCCFLDHNQASTLLSSNGPNGIEMWDPEPETASESEEVLHSPKPKSATLANVDPLPYIDNDPDRAFYPVFPSTGVVGVAAAVDDSPVPSLAPSPCRSHPPVIPPRPNRKPTTTSSSSSSSSAFGFDGATHGMMHDYYY